MQRELIALADLRAPADFLDLGCGTGWAVCHAASILKGNGRFVGVDISEGMIAKARSNAVDTANVEFYEASAEQLPFGNDAFDTVICSNSFHHYLHPEEVLKEVRRVLKLNGKIFILDITADDFFIRWIDATVRAREMEHVKFYGTAEYARMFAAAGLKHPWSRRVKILYPLKVHAGVKEN
jgi:ubiquinone/menaquinone biosynthesis C-methylase UbiE